MTTYVYETIPAKEGDSVEYFEIKQSMKDAPLTQHPETGQAIRRIILGGFGILTSENSSPASSGSCGCARVDAAAETGKKYGSKNHIGEGSHGVEDHRASEGKRPHAHSQRHAGQGLRRGTLFGQRGA